MHDVSVEFPIYQGGGRSLKKSLLSGRFSRNLTADSSNRLTVSALRGCNLAIEAGDRLAIVGHNGAGKSTLLKVLAGVYAPTRGHIETSGKVTALLSASLGFNLEATGRENIITHGMFMGIHPREMSRAVEEIAEFTELDAYIDMPVRTYSSGMMLRLSFAATTAITPDILLLDEWLGAGDAAFFAKAQKRLEHFIGRSAILVLASHSTPLLEQWCNRAILVEQGQILAQGNVQEVVARYQQRT